LKYLETILFLLITVGKNSLKQMFFNIQIQATQFSEIRFATTVQSCFFVKGHVLKIPSTLNFEI